MRSSARAPTRAVTATEGHGALGARHQDVAQLALCAHGPRLDHGGPQQTAHLESAFQAAPGLGHVPAGIADHVRRHTLQREEGAEHPTRGLGDLVVVAVRPQRALGPRDGGEHAPRVAGQLVSDALERLTHPLDGVCRSTHALGVE
jgi:hypothetical protein